jgi:MYXO-CTERM domain-containing protein
MPAHRPRWAGTLLYPAGLVALFLGLQVLSAPFGLPEGSRASLGGMVALLALMVSLPIRLRVAWGVEDPWQQLGVARAPLTIAKSLGRGLVKASLLLALVGGGLLLTGQAHWLGQDHASSLLNALALGVGVGFAEELLFRGWLLSELDAHLGAGRALLAQAVVFSLVHTRFNLGGPALLGLLGGLGLLGLALGLQRHADGGSLWGAVGLHGGLVGGWFALQSGLLSLSPTAPSWLIGPGGPSPNPIGGALGWAGLGLLVAWRRRWWPGR